MAFFPFVVIGHLPVNRQLKECYKAYCATVENPPPRVMATTHHDRPATNLGAFYGAALANVACAGFGYSQVKNKSEDDTPIHVHSLQRREIYHF
jgi:hypothetical protein